MITIQGIPIIKRWRASHRAARQPASSIDARTIIEDIERHAQLPVGREDRFAGYAVLGLPFRSGHVLSLRRFPASSVGPGYTSVWHRNPAGRWTFYSTVAPEQGCSRYFGREIETEVVTPIHVEWLGPAQFLVVIRDAITWTVTLSQTMTSRIMNTAARSLPEGWWRKRAVLGCMGIAARFILGTGRMNLAGRTPNGQDFVANPRQVWLVNSSQAIINGVDAGPLGPLAEQARLRDFWIPQRGVFAVARAFLGTPSSGYPDTA